MLKFCCVIQFLSEFLKLRVWLQSCLVMNNWSLTHLGREQLVFQWDKCDNELRKMMTSFLFELFSAGNVAFFSQEYVCTVNLLQFQIEYAIRYKNTVVCLFYQIIFGVYVLSFSFTVDWQLLWPHLNTFKLSPICCVYSVIIWHSYLFIQA